MGKSILLISNMYPSDEHPNYGRFVKRCADYLSDRGFSVTVVAVSASSTLMSKLAQYAKMFWNANRLIIGRQYDVIYIHHALQALLVAMPSLLLGRRSYVLNFHGDDLQPTALRGRLLHYLLRPLYRKARAVLVPSRHFANLFDHRYQTPDLKAEIFSSGGIGETFFAKPVPLPEMRPPSALFLSRLVEQKGWRDFLLAAQRISHERPDFHFTVAGVGDTWEIRSAIEKLGLASVVDVVETSSDTSNVCLFNSHRYFIFPTRFDESLALVNIEAMASGCVTLSSDFMAAAEYIEDGVNGFRLPLKDFSVRAAATVLALEDDHLRQAAISAKAIATAASYRETFVMSRLPSLLGLVE